MFVVVLQIFITLKAGDLSPSALWIHIASKQVDVSFALAHAGDLSPSALWIYIASKQVDVSFALAHACVVASARLPPP